MSDYFYQGFVDDESIVSYSAPNLKSSLSTVYCFLSAATLLIETIKKTKGSAGNDRFLAPLFLLYVNAIELLMKILLIETNSSKSLGNHNLNDLFDKVSKADLTKWKNKTKCLALLEKITEEFSEYGIESISTRYIYDKFDKKPSSPYGMHAKQFNVRIIELNDDINTI